MLNCPLNKPSHPWTTHYREPIDPTDLDQAIVNGTELPPTAPGLDPLNAGGGRAESDDKLAARDIHPLLGRISGHKKASSGGLRSDNEEIKGE